jgi:hypothetical protein
VRSQPIVDYITFGTNHEYLEGVQAGYPIHGPNYVLKTLDRYLAFLPSFGLPVTLRAASDLRDIRKELNEEAPDALLDAEGAIRVSREVKALWRTLSAEAAGNIALHSDRQTL